MPDREKVITGLNDIGGFIAGRIGFEQARNFLRTIDEAIALLKEHGAEIENLKQTAQSMMEGVCLLKEQEAKTVDSIQLSRGSDCDLTGYCPSCQRPLKAQFNQSFCGRCGQPILWEGR